MRGITKDFVLANVSIAKIWSDSASPKGVPDCQIIRKSGRTTKETCDFEEQPSLGDVGAATVRVGRVDHAKVGIWMIGQYICSSSRTVGPC